MAQRRHISMIDKLLNLRSVGNPLNRSLPAAQDYQDE